MRRISIILSMALVFIFGPSSLNAQTIKDIDGNEYKTVKIGDQIWMAENLKTTKFNDGTAIPLVADNKIWNALTTPGYCWFDNKTENSSEYGALYNGFAMETGKLCPAGWMVPSDKDWEELQKKYDYYIGLKLKEAGTKHWKDNPASVTNESGFTALGGGYRNSTGSFGFLQGTAIWWSNSLFNEKNYITRALYATNPSMAKGDFPRNSGNSVRCIKKGGNETGTIETIQPEPSQSLKDIDGNEYKTVKIGDQVWMAENLKTSKLNDGTVIPMVADKDAWKNLSTFGYAWYNNEQVTHGAVYGALYNGYVVISNKVCPSGWHVPTNNDWDNLQKNYGAYAGIQLKEKGNQYWKNNSEKVTNESGFTALGGGYRHSLGTFNFLNETCIWWTSSMFNDKNMATRAMYGSNATIAKGDFPKNLGAYIRCVKH